MNKEEILRLADEFAGRVEARVDNNKARTALESAITLALAAERRRALEEAADLCVKRNAGAYAQAIRALIDGKTP